MSYILEALKKSDRERKQGKVPDLETVQDINLSRKRSPRPVWPYAAIGLLIICGLLWAAWLLWPGKNASAPAPQETTVTKETAPATVPVAERIKVDDLSPKTAPAEADGSTALSGQPSPASPTSGETGDSAISTSLSAFPAEEEAPANEENPIAAVSDTPSETAPDQAEADSLAENPDELSPTPEVVDDRIVDLENLPSNLKDELPEISIGVHLYSENPLSRRASVNGRLLREGQQVSRGLLLEEITRNGAILSFRGRKFRVPVFPR